MKNFSLIFAAILLTALAAGCSSTEKRDNAVKPVIITGKISNLDVYPDYRIVTASVIDFRNRQKTYTDSIKPDGTFRVELDLYTTQDINFTPIVRTLMARPGDSIFIHIDFADIASVQFSGDFAKANEDYHAYVNSYFHVDYYSQYYWSDRENTDLMHFMAFADSVKLLVEGKREEFLNKVDPEPEISRWSKEYIEFNYYLALFRRLQDVSMMKRNDENWSPPEVYIANLKNLENALTEPIMSSNGYSLPNNFLNPYTRPIELDSVFSEKAHFHFLEEFYESHSNPVFREMLVAQVFHSNLMMQNIEIFEDDPELIDRIITHDFIRYPLMDFYEETKAKIENPMLVHEPIMKSLQNTVTGSFMDSIIDAHYGKAVYLYMWTTWCGPCIASFPALRETISELSNEEIEFVLVCMGTSEEEWEGHRDKFGDLGIHYYTSRELSSNLTKDLKISAIPQVFLIDQQGIITERGSYLSAGNPATISKIQKLLDNHPVIL
jgi:thiol-disulfide isomerase/thioredoxin